LLWLHGGPGGSEMGYSYRYSNHLQDHYVFVQWDQRESGKTGQLNHSPDLKLDQIHQDVHDVITYLLSTFNRKKIFLVGNSWGGHLALYEANGYPDLLEACILVSPSIYANESEALSLQYVIHESKTRENKKAIDEIATIKVPFERSMDLWLLRKWMFTFHGDNVSRALPPENIFLELVEKWLPVIKEYESYNPFTEINEMHCPVFILVGSEDYITHPEITERFYNQLKAPKKNIYHFNVGHMITTQRSGKMQDVITNDIPAYLNSK
jgi:pimeloyl-ACP methyl ester carboxylesterase